MSLKYRIIPVTPFQQNCSLIWCDETMKGAVVDPGGDLDKIRRAIEEEGMTIEKILLTHAHIDHAVVGLMVRPIYTPRLRLGFPGPISFSN